MITFLLIYFAVCCLMLLVAIAINVFYVFILDHFSAPEWTEKLIGIALIGLMICAVIVGIHAIVRLT